MLDEGNDSNNGKTKAITNEKNNAVRQVNGLYKEYVCETDIAKKGKIRSKMLKNKCISLRQSRCAGVLRCLLVSDLLLFCDWLVRLRGACGAHAGHARLTHSRALQYEKYNPE